MSRIARNLRGAERGTLSVNDRNGQRVAGRNCHSRIVLQYTISDSSPFFVAGGALV